MRTVIAIITALACTVAFSAEKAKKAKKEAKAPEKAKVEQVCVKPDGTPDEAWKLGVNKPEDCKEPNKMAAPKPVK